VGASNATRERGVRVRTVRVIVTAAARSRLRWLLLVVFVVFMLVIAAGCGGSSDRRIAGRTTSVPADHNGSANGKNNGSDHDNDTGNANDSGNDSGNGNGNANDDGSDNDDGNGNDDCGATAPCDPGTPREIPQGPCRKVLGEQTETIEASSGTEAEAHALRAFAKLCLGMDASGDMAVAQQNKDELTTGTREALTAVVDAQQPRGAELQKVLQDVESQQGNP
jgi:hypothetical protein